MSSTMRQEPLAQREERCEPLSGSQPMSQEESHHAGDTLQEMSPTTLHDSLHDERCGNLSFPQPRPRLDARHYPRVDNPQQDEPQPLYDDDVHEGALNFMEISAITPKDKQRVPEEYHDYLDIFDADNARKLPPFREGFDFKIDLIPDKPWPAPSKPY